MNTWYEASSGNHQGIIVDEVTGKNIAVSYVKNNAKLIAATPELLEACEIALGILHMDSAMEKDFYYEIRILTDAIQKATE